MIIFLLTIVILSSVLHTKIVTALQPFIKWAHKTPAGFLVPIAIFIVISFPPLFGQEFVAIICGMAWGAGVGFAIVCAGTIIGEILNFFVFKYMCTARSEKWQKESIAYATTCKVIDDGGLLVAIVARYSVLPSHYTTAVFASCGMRFYTFLIAAVVSTPTQFANVYIGTTYVNDSPTGKTVNTVVLVLTILITIDAQRFIRFKLNKARPDVVYARRKARQSDALAKMYQNGSTAGLIQNSASHGAATPPYHSRDNSESTIQVPLQTV